VVPPFFTGIKPVSAEYYYIPQHLRSCHVMKYSVNTFDHALSGPFDELRTVRFSPILILWKCIFHRYLRINGLKLSIMNFSLK